MELMHFCSFTHCVLANWRSFEDTETGIYGYAWCIGTSPGTCDTLPFTDPHAHLSNQDFWTNTGLATFTDLPDGPYFITIQAINNVQYGGPQVTTVQHSTEYLVDTTCPILSGVEVISYNASTNQLVVVFNARLVGCFGFHCMLFRYKVDADDCLS